MKKLTETFKSKFTKILIIALLLVVFQTELSYSVQDTLIIGAISDNTLYEDAAGSISNGQGKYLFSGKGSTGLTRRGLINFLLIEFIPPCSKILSVSLKMHLSGGTTANKTIQLRRLNNYWGEGNSNAPGLEENGTAADNYDATWKHRYYNTDLWSSVGGDYSSTVSGSAVVGAPGYYTFNSTPQMVNDAQLWIDDFSQSCGWILIGDESASSSAKRFHSSEADTISFVPELTVIYKTADLELYLESIIEGFWDGSNMIDDSLKVSLRSAVSPYAKVDSAVKVSGTYGASYCFFNATSGNYYITVNHRNSIETWSKLPVAMLQNGFNTYDFTDLSTKAYGDNEVFKLAEYCIYSGDVNQDATIDVTDLSIVENDAGNSLSGYVPSDLTGDDFVDVVDLSIVENNIGVNSITP